MAAIGSAMRWYRSESLLRTTARCPAARRPRKGADSATARRSGRPGVHFDDWSKSACTSATVRVSPRCVQDTDCNAAPPSQSSAGAISQRRRFWSVASTSSTAVSTGNVRNQQHATQRRPARQRRIDKGVAGEQPGETREKYRQRPLGGGPGEGEVERGKESVRGPLSKQLPTPFEQCQTGHEEGHQRTRQQRRRAAVDVDADVNPRKRRRRTCQRRTASPARSAAPCPALRPSSQTTAQTKSASLAKSRRVPAPTARARRRTTPPTPSPRRACRNSLPAGPPVAGNGCPGRCLGSRPSQVQQTDAPTVGVQDAEVEAARG